MTTRIAKDPLSLSRWFAAHCGGEGEHHHGISIEITDNAGWWVKIAIGRIELAGRSLATLSEHIDAKGFLADARWLHCHLKDERVARCRRRGAVRTDHRDFSGPGQKLRRAHFRHARYLALGSL